MYWWNIRICWRFVMSQNTSCLLIQPRKVYLNYCHFLNKVDIGPAADAHRSIRGPAVAFMWQAGDQSKFFCSLRTCTQFNPQGSKSAQTDYNTLHYIINLRILHFITMVFCNLHFINVKGKQDGHQYSLNICCTMLKSINSRYVFMQTVADL